MQETLETQVQSLGWGDPLEGGMVTHSSILAWETPWTEEPGGLQSRALQRVGHNWSDWACIFTYSRVVSKNQVNLLRHLNHPFSHGKYWLQLYHLLLKISYNYPKISFYTPGPVSSFLVQESRLILASCVILTFYNSTAYGYLLLLFPGYHNKTLVP